MVSPQRSLPGPLAVEDTDTGSLCPDPIALLGHALAHNQMGLVSPDARDGCPSERRPPGPHPNVSLCLSPPTPPSWPWHSNQCPLTSYLAISVNQLKFARCHKNIYTFYAIGKFKSSSCALLPRKLHSTLIGLPRNGGLATWGKAGLGQLEQLCQGICCLDPRDLGLELCWTHTHQCYHSMIYTVLGGGREKTQAILRNLPKLLPWVLESHCSFFFLGISFFS